MLTLKGDFFQRTFFYQAYWCWRTITAYVAVFYLAKKSLQTVTTSFVFITPTQPDSCENKNLQMIKIGQQPRGPAGRHGASRCGDGYVPATDQLIQQATSEKQTLGMGAGTFHLMKSLKQWSDFLNHIMGERRHLQVWVLWVSAATKLVFHRASQGHSCCRVGFQWKRRRSLSLRGHRGKAWLRSWSQAHWYDWEACLYSQ